MFTPRHGARRGVQAFAFMTCTVLAVLMAGCSENTPTEPPPDAAVTVTDSLGVWYLAPQRVKTVRWSAAMESLVYEHTKDVGGGCIGCPYYVVRDLSLLDPLEGTETRIAKSMFSEKWWLSADGSHCFVLDSNVLDRFDLRNPAALPVRAFYEIYAHGVLMSPGDSLIAWYEPADPYGTDMYPLDRLRIRRLGQPGSAVDGGRGRPLAFSPDARQLIVSRVSQPTGGLISLWLLDIATLDSLALPIEPQEFPPLAITWNGASPRLYGILAPPHRIVENEPLAQIRSTLLEIPFGDSSWVAALDVSDSGQRIVFTSRSWTDGYSYIWLWNSESREMNLVSEGLYSVGGGEILPDEATFAVAINGKLYLVPLSAGN